MMVQQTMYLAIILFGLMPTLWAATKECNSNALPSAAQKLLTQHFPAWKPVTLSDLIPDDRQWWSEHHQDDCPGIIEGDFSKTHSFAIALMRSDHGNLLQALVLLEPSKDGYALHTLSAPSKAAGPNILLKFPPGTYRDAEQTRSVRTRFDGVAYIKLEAAGTLYYKTRQGFASLEISE